MPLTQFAIVNAHATEKPRKLSDGDGLYLLVQSNGPKRWRFRYRFLGRENTLALGSFPTVTLARARSKREEVRKLLDAGIDPATKRRLDRIAAATAARNTFGDVAVEYLDNMRDGGAAATTLSKNRWMLADLAAPLARRPIADITPAEILHLLKKIEKSGRRETARRLRGTIGGVFRLAIVTLRATTDPTIPLQRALLSPKVRHRAAFTDEAQLGALMASIDNYDGWPMVRAALQLLALTVTRPGDVRLMRRSEVDLERAIWRIPAERMKMRRPHDVPLSRQALAVLWGIWTLFENSDFVLPSVRSWKRPLSEVAMIAALRRMGYTPDEVTPQGFRASASTILNARRFNPDVIEAALAHQDENEIRRAYNRSTFWPERIELLQAWADLLDEFKLDPKRNLRAA